ncbi:MAG: ABC transporter ATP-binding protein [Devosia sp.]|nr:ABC transporter ATP-binding protein [Devosia sp.]
MNMAPQIDTDTALLDVCDLSVAFPTPRGPILPVNHASFRVGRGRSLGLVGESGSGKSVTLRAILGIVPPPGRVASGTVRLGPDDLTRLSASRLRAVRGKAISMNFQDPMASLNPVLTVGDQIVETLRVKAGLRGRAAIDHAVSLFERVGIREPRHRLRDFPHQFSGGMAQRVMIAIAIAAEPQLLLADEPTTALDVSIQDQVLDLLAALKAELGMAMILVSHDIGVIARSCDQVAVMYAGRILERGRVEDVLLHPRHPYTAMLIGSVPSLVPNIGRKPLATISGQLPDLTTVREGCPFRTRCPHAREACAAVGMALDAPEEGHGSACPFVEASA